MTIELRALDRFKGAVGTLLAGIFLLCAAGAAPRATPQSPHLRDAVAAPASPAATLRAPESVVRSARSLSRVELFTPPRAIALAPAAFIAIANEVAIASGPSTSVVGRGYDATAPPTRS